MPVCRQCGKLIKPLGIPVSLEEKVGAYLSKILEQVRYESGQRVPSYPVPAIPMVAEFVHNVNVEGNYFIGAGVSIVLWKAPCELVHVWSDR